MKALIRLIRPKQWVKNMFVFIPLFFGGRLFNLSDFMDALIVFIAFCFVASSIYCFNDVIDAEADRKHPVKRLRPVASGAVSVPQAYAIMTFMFVLSVLVTILLSVHWIEVVGVIVFYFLLNIAYCAKLKQYAIVDVCVVAFGFVLRIMAGGIATDILLSNWIVLMTFLLTLFLSFAKRRDDVIKMNESGVELRKNITRYNLTFINQAITITASVTLVCYIMYTVSPEVTSRLHTHYLYLTTIFVLLGLLRYIQIAVVDKKSGDPTKVILRDPFTQIIVAAWTLTFLIMLYLL
jgi:decaprenyl-phosphate phosphoribosyltransferase